MTDPTGTYADLDADHDADHGGLEAEYAELEAGVAAAERRVAARHDGILRGGAPVTVAVTLVASVVCLWQSRPDSIGLTAQVGPAGGQWTAIVLGGLALLLLAAALRRPTSGLVGTAAASVAIAALVAASGIDSDWRVTGPGPWLAAAGFTLAAGLTAGWARTLR
jgi:hypothetical protein